jgi:hypothetical protein
MHWVKGKYGNEKIDNCSLDLSIDRSSASFRSTNTFLQEGGGSLDGPPPVLPGAVNESNDDSDQESMCHCLCSGFNICSAMLSHVFAPNHNSERDQTIRR